MPRPDALLPDADGLETEPSTRRVALGSPASNPTPAGEPNFSAHVDPADAVFAALKASISRLWDEGASAADIQGALREEGRE